MSIVVSKKDVVWSYLSIFFQMAAGVLILPFILHMLSADEVGFNYIMLTIGSLINLFDAGFSPMFGKNISFVFSGAQELKKEGVFENESGEINNHLLATIIRVAEVVYKRVSVFSVVALLTIGSLYIWFATNGFSSVHNAIMIWIVFCSSSFFNIYFSYYNSLLIGSGKIKENKQAVIATRIGYITISIILLYAGFGLLGVCLANLIAPFIGRYISYRVFFTQELRQLINSQIVTPDEVGNTFNTIWYNAKKMIIASIGTYSIYHFGFFIAGVYLPLSEVGSYGLLVQLCTIITSLSQTFFVVKQPQMAACRIQKNYDKLAALFSLAITVFFLMIIPGYLICILFGQDILGLIRSNTILPSMLVMAVYCLVALLEANHALCATFITVGNRVPPIGASLIPGFFIASFDFLVLQFTEMGILGLILVQGLCQLAYNNWKWPMEALKDLQMTPVAVLKLGTSQISSLIYRYVRF